MNNKQTFISAVKNMKNIKKDLTDGSRR